MRRRRAFTLAFVVVVVALLAGALAPGLQGQAPVSPLPSSLPFHRLVQGQHLFITDRGLRAFRDQRAWASFWLQAGLPGDPVAVDFASTMVVAVLMGQQATGGHAIRVSSLVRLGPEVVMGIVESNPGAGCSPVQGATEPFDIVALAAGTSDPLPLHRSVTTAC